MDIRQTLWAYAHRQEKKNTTARGSWLFYFIPMNTAACYLMWLCTCVYLCTVVRGVWRGVYAQTRKLCIYASPIPVGLLWTEWSLPQNIWYIFHNSILSSSIGRISCLDKCLLVEQEKAPPFWALHLCIAILLPKIISMAATISLLSQPLSSSARWTAQCACAGLGRMMALPPVLLEGDHQNGWYILEKEGAVKNIMCSC